MYTSEGTLQTENTLTLPIKNQEANQLPFSQHKKKLKIIVLF